MLTQICMYMYQWIIIHKIYLNSLFYVIFDPILLLTYFQIWSNATLLAYESWNTSYIWFAGKMVASITLKLWIMLILKVWQVFGFFMLVKYHDHSGKQSKSYGRPKPEGRFQFQNSILSNRNYIPDKTIQNWWQASPTLVHRCYHDNVDIHNFSAKKFKFSWRF